MYSIAKKIFLKCRRQFFDPGLNKLLFINSFKTSNHFRSAFAGHKHHTDKKGRQIGTYIASLKKTKSISAFHLNIKQKIAQVTVYNVRIYFLGKLHANLFILGQS